MQFKNSISDHKVINTIRFMAICSVVWGHCSFASETREFTNTSDPVLQSVMIEFGRLGTVMFFIISGFLMRPQLKDYTVWTFLKGRFRSTLLPWIIFVLLFAVLELYNNSNLKAIFMGGNIFHRIVSITVLLKANVFYFAYWFIVVFVISAMLLIVLKKYIDTPWMGIGLGIITVFYCINLHYGWITTHHTKAFLGYAFFMWLGIQLRKHYGKFVEIMRRMDWGLLTVVFLLTFVLACYEALGLKNAGCADAYASIRFSNIIVSLIAFCCLYKAGSMTWVDQMHLRGDIYGVYLLHSIIVYELNVALTPFLKNSTHVIRSEISFMNAQILLFVIIMSMSILLVKAFKLALDSFVQWWPGYLSNKLLLIRAGLNSLNGTGRPATVFINAARIAALIIIPFVSCFYLAGKLI